MKKTIDEISEEFEWRDEKIRKLERENNDRKDELRKARGENMELLAQLDVFRSIESNGILVSEHIELKREIEFLEGKHENILEKVTRIRLLSNDLAIWLEKNINE